jgi:hypothetical protein
MDELFWGRDHEDVNDWAERLTMAAEVRDLNADKLFKIAKLNLRGRAKEWFKKLQPGPTDWAELKTLIVQKYGHVDDDDIRMKLDAIKQEPKERVQKYFERLDKLFQRGKIPDAEQRRRFLAKLRPEIWKLCVVRTFADVEELVATATEVKRVLGELGETPFEALREEQEEGIEETIMEKQVTALNNTLVNFFKRSVPSSTPSSSSTISSGCQLCNGGDHIATACPRLDDDGRNVPSAICHIGRKIVGLSALSAQDWDTQKTDVGRSRKMERRILELPTLWKSCWMTSKRLCSN